MKRKVVRNVIFAFCEGETERMYLQCFGAFSKVKIYAPKIGGVSVSNLDRQISIIWECLKNPYGINKMNIAEYQIKLFYIVDIDTIESKNDVDVIKKRFKEEGIDILFSNKNMELFVLEHYEYYDKEIDNYISEIKKLEPNYKKGESLKTKGVFEVIIENNTDTMKQNIKRLKNFHLSSGRTHIYDMNPYSEIIDLIEYIEGISENS